MASFAFRHADRPLNLQCEVPGKEEVDTQEIFRKAG